MRKKRKAFTLVEVILVVALLGVVTTVSYSIFFAGGRSFEVGAEKAIEQADYRILREHLVNELRYVNYLENNEPEDSDENEFTKKIFYSLKIENNKLIKTKYENNVKIEPSEFSIELDDLTSKLQMKIKDLNIKESNNINVGFGSETESSFTIFLENKPLIENSIPLLNGTLSKDTREIFYTYPEYLVAKSTNDKVDDNEDIVDSDQADFSIGRVLGRILKYKGSSKIVVIPPTIKGIKVRIIAVDSFNGKNVESVTIPEGVIRLEDRAFMDNNLKSIIIPESVKEINS